MQHGRENSKFCSNMQPVVSAWSEMWRWLNVLRSIESIAWPSLLSIYSTSGLLKESQVDIVSSIETESPSDLLGESSMLQGTGMATEPSSLLWTAVNFGKTSSLVWIEVTFGRTTAVDLTLKDADRLLPEIPLLLVLAGDPFFTLAILLAHGTFRYEIHSG